jgi:hypothetical protein
MCKEQCTQPTQEVSYLINFALFLLRNRTNFNHISGQNAVRLHLVELL